MTAVDERLKRGEERRLIFQNMANAVPMEQIKAAFSRSDEEVWREVDYVSRKIREARFRTCMPPLDCMGLKAIRWNRKALLETLEQLRDEYLASDIIMPNIGVETIESASILRQAAQEVRARVTESR